MTDRDVDTTTFLLTGATGAIGKAIAIQLARTANSNLVLVCRNRQKAQQSIKDIIQASGNLNVNYELADFIQDRKQAVLDEEIKSIRHPYYWGDLNVNSKTDSWKYQSNPG